MWVHEVWLGVGTGGLARFGYMWSYVWMHEVWLGVGAVLGKWGAHGVWLGVST